jgi:hypothetical protein
MTESQQKMEVIGTLYTSMEIMDSSRMPMDKVLNTINEGAGTPV